MSLSDSGAFFASSKLVKLWPRSRKATWSGDGTRTHGAMRAHEARRTF